MASVESRQQALNGQIDVSAEAVADGVAKLLVVVSNLTASRELPPVSLLSRSFVSTHAILDVETGGEFVSMTDPPAELALAAAECRNIRLWPVLAGDASQRNTVLASPIILSDYPQIAPESAGDFFDGTEIDEMLALRVLTMTDEEKDQARRTDPRARLLVDRTEALSDEQLLKLHGVLRGMRPVNDGASR
jgi:hydrogenase maturation protease